MALHLAEIATMVATGAHAVLVLDKAERHVSKALAVPLNITLIPLPARSPELTPVENNGQFMRENRLSIGHCCEAWNKLIDQPWKIMSIGVRD